MIQCRLNLGNTRVEGLCSFVQTLGSIRQRSHAAVQFLSAGQQLSRAVIQLRSAVLQFPGAILEFLHSIQQLTGAVQKLLRRVVQFIQRILQFLACLVARQLQLIQKPTGSHCHRHVQLKVRDLCRDLHAVRNLQFFVIPVIRLDFFL